jgi:hypothetical protein
VPVLFSLLSLPVADNLVWLVKVEGSFFATI